MDYGGGQKPGTIMGARARGPRRGRRPSGVYGLVVLALLAFLGAWSLGVIGCSGTGTGNVRTEDAGSLFANMRQSPEEIARLKHNAHYYALMGQPEMGLKELELAHQKNPDDLQITDSLAQRYEDLGKFDAARQLYREALTRHGPHAALANNLCFSYYRQGRWQEAEACFRQTLDHDPGNVAARNNLGLLYCRLGRQDEARRLWQEAEGVAAADAKMSEALALLGRPASALYARKPEPASPAAGAIQAPKREAAAAQVPASVPTKPVTPAQPVTPKVPAEQLATKTPAPTPAPVATKTIAPAPAPVAAKTPVPKPAQVAANTPEPKPSPVAAKPRPEPREQTVSPPKALAAAAPSPAPQAAPRPSPATPLTVAERLDTAIEVRNGTWTKNLAHQTRSLLQQEGFTVAKIGNHVDFGAAKTIIYYRPGAERVAQALSCAVFPSAELQPSPRLNKGTDIKVLLGRDLVDNPQFMTRLHDGGPPAAPLSPPPASTETHVAAKTKAEPPAASHQEPQGVSRATAGPGQQPLAAQPKEVAAQPPASPAPVRLTAEELMGTAIEVRNGTWTKDLARRTRSLLSQEGFTVTKIGNHIDFGATKTIIYYRPGAEKVARALGRTVFPPATLEPSLKLKHGVDIKILLGADLLQRPLLMARLFPGDI